MTIEISDALKERIIYFCNDELNYHIWESCCANEYHDEILAEIELLFLVGEKEKALDFAKLYSDCSKEDFYVSEKLSKEQKKELKDLIKMIKRGK